MHLTVTVPCLDVCASVALNLLIILQRLELGKCIVTPVHVRTQCWG